MRTGFSIIFVIFTFLLSVSSFGQIVDEQTKRVVGDSVIWGMLHPYIKKYKVSCQISVSDSSSNINPHWTCLNNSACSYNLKVTCLEKKTPHLPFLEIEVSGFDNNNENKVQNFKVTYLQK